MASSFDNCGTCYLRHVSKLSVVWCSECDEGLCHDCEEHHTLSKASRNHKIVPIDECHKLPSFITNIKLHCDEHGEKYQLFCIGHSEVLCRKCVISGRHRECTKISPVEDVIQNAKTSVAFTEISSSLQEMKENLIRILEDKQKNIFSISASKKIIESEISAIRKQLNHHLDEIQHHFIDELNKAVENSTKKIQSFIVSLKENQKVIDECIEDLETIKKHATDMQTFLGIEKLEAKLKKTENNFQSCVNDHNLAYIVVSYKLNNRLQDINKEINTFGKTIVYVKPCELTIQRRKEDQAQVVKFKTEPKSSIDRITLTLITKMNTTATKVTGCCILPCGKLVVSNYMPAYLILLSSDGNIEKKLTMSMRMGNIEHFACVNNETVAVLSSPASKIKLVDIESGKTCRKIPTNTPCCGLTYNEGKFIVCPENGRMQEVGLEDSKTKVIGSQMVSRYTTTLGDTLYSIKRSTNTIVCHKRNGEILWTFTDKEVLDRPRGITVDGHGNAIVAGVNSNNIIAISADGKKYKILLSQCISPWAVFYNQKSSCLLVSNHSDGHAFVYSVNYL